MACDRQYRTVPSYRSLFAVREFRVLFLNRCVVMISVAASGLALGTVTFQATRSPVLTGLSMFGGPLVSLVASPMLLASSDRVRPRTALMYQMGGALAADALQLIPGMPWEWRFLLLAIPYVVNSMFSGTQWVIVRDIVPDGSFVLARSVLNLAVSSMQVIGYAAGGLALLWLSPHGLFAAAAVADLLALVNVRLGIRDRPARDTDRGGNVVHRTMAANRALLGSAVTRPLYLALWVPSGLVVGCESLFVPYGHTASRGAAGWLFAATAAGMMGGDLIVGRFVPEARRDQLIVPLQMLMGLPYLVFFLGPPLPIAVAVGFCAAAGYAASLPLQGRLIHHADDAVHGQAMGLYGTGLMVGQAIGALIAGAVASWVPPAAAIGTMAAASTAVTLLLTPGLRRSAKPAATASSHPASVRTNK